jgi:hypothetical protein
MAWNARIGPQDAQEDSGERVRVVNNSDEADREPPLVRVVKNYFPSPVSD